MIMRRIENEVDLQNAATSTILGRFTKKEDFAKDEIVEEIQKDENFGNFCNEYHLREVVTDTIEHFVRNSYFEYNSSKERYFPLK